MSRSNCHRRRDISFRRAILATMRVQIRTEVAVRLNVPDDDARDPFIYVNQVSLWNLIMFREHDGGSCDMADLLRRIFVA